MPASTSLRGICSFCGLETEQSLIQSHLASCEQRQQQIAATHNAEQPDSPIFQLWAYNPRKPQFWLELEMHGNTHLADIDRYLRAIWLECCGHSSVFMQGGWHGQEMRKIKRVNKIFREGVELSHFYDPNTPSETRVQYVGERLGQRLNTRAIVLLARNSPPDERCMECQAPATHVCMQCVYEHEALSGTLCEQHANSHPHDTYGEPVRLFNSPRVGMCDYHGPAQPPY